jgi:hypothetical protein
MINMYDISHMRANSKLLYCRTIGEIRKNFCAESGQKNNVLASSSFNISNFKNWISNDKSLFERAVSVESLKRAWYLLKCKSGISITNARQFNPSRVDDSWFIQMSQKLGDGSFRPLLHHKSIRIFKFDSTVKTIPVKNPGI